MQRALVFGIAAVFLACASESGPSASGPRVSREETKVSSIRARVAAVDHTTRVVTLVDSTGAKTIFRADEAVRNLPQVKVGDEVVGSLVESLAIEVRKATPQDQTTPPTLAEALARAEPGQRPAGLYVRQIQALYTIESIDKAQGGGTLRDSSGQSTFVKVRDPSVLDRVKVGDTVVVTLTQGMSLEVVTPGS
jgi:hypothetical protein